MSPPFPVSSWLAHHPFTASLVYRDTMKDYLIEIIIPYIEAQRDLINEPNKPAVVIIIQQF